MSTAVNPTRVGIRRLQLIGAMSFISIQLPHGCIGSDYRFDPRRLSGYSRRVCLKVAMLLSSPTVVSEPFICWKKLSIPHIAYNLTSLLKLYA